RLGFGKGYFDEFLACIPAQVPTVALAFEAQIVASVPTTEKDVKVKKIVTEKRTIATQDLNISKSI
ncbi:MAG: hypothetical protein HYW50_03550, partial [Candidatus Diapherotrites archaeon]|nr:hypothetical protein [Candidatus Diapherotrites archaeon]